MAHEWKSEKEKENKDKKVQNGTGPNVESDLTCFDTKKVDAPTSSFPQPLPPPRPPNQQPECKLQRGAKRTVWHCRVRLWTWEIYQTIMYW